MPLPIDLFAEFRIAIDAFWYNTLLNLAAMHWGLLRGLVTMGYTVELMNRWLAQVAFAPLIALTNDSLRVGVTLAFVVALLVLGITYLLAAFVRLDVVRPRSAIAWYGAGVLFYSLGPQLYLGLIDFRAAISEGFYVSALAPLQGSIGTAFAPLGSVETSDLAMGALCDHLGDYLPAGGGRIDGLDVALSYLRADGIDVMGYHPARRGITCPPHPPDAVTGRYTAGPIPTEWLKPGSFFQATRSAPTFPFMTDAERQSVLAMAASAQGRLLTAWPLVVFGVVEQLVYLLITLAQGITFVSFGIAILFAFFKRTEAIAQSIMNQWIELLIQTVVIALIQALVVALFLAATAGGGAMVALGVGLICLVFMLIVLWSGVKAVWNAFNRLFVALGQATGGVIITPGAAALTATAGAALAAGGAAAVVGSAASTSANALAGINALNAGATQAQAAGLTFGGNTTLTSAARTLAHLPGLRDTALGEAAEQFVEGAVVRRVARDLPGVGGVAGPLVGALLLTDRDPAAAQVDERGRVLSRPMLNPAVGELLDVTTLPAPAKSKRRPPADEMWTIEDEDGEPLATFRRPSRADDDFIARESFADNQRGEEMEQHITERIDSVGTPFMASAANTPSASTPPIPTTLRIDGIADVAGALGAAITQAGRGGATGIDHLSLADALARALGVAPLPGQPPVTADLTRLGVFADGALRLGISGAQAETIIREVKTSPDGRMSDALRDAIAEGFRAAGQSPTTASANVERLERYAALIPTHIDVTGVMSGQIDPTNE
jgi:hypothetical protein